MKFKPVPSEEQTPYIETKAKNPKTMNRNQTLVERSEHESISDDQSSDDNSEDLSDTPKSQHKDAFMINDQMNLNLKDLSPAKITKALVGTNNAAMNNHFKEQDSQQVKYGKDRFSKFADVFSPKGQRKIRVSFDHGQNVRITSSLVKRMELEHIEDVIE